MDRTPVVAAVGSGALAEAWQRFTESTVGPADQKGRVSAIQALEDLKDAACAAQAELAVAVVEVEVAVADAVSDDADRDAECSARARARRTARARRSAIAQVALARRESPHRAGVLVGVGEALVREMPYTLVALRSGAINEFRATVLVRETACLDRADRAEVDEAICGDPRSLAGLGTRRLVAAAKAEAYRLDPHAIVRRADRDAQERCVTLRPAPGSMTYLTALVPMAQGVAMLANLQRTADSARATGDERSKGQVMADTLVERVTGQSSADAVPVMVNLVMSDATLLASGHEPAVLDGANMVPAQLARELVARAMEYESDARPALPPGRSQDVLRSAAAGPPGSPRDAERIAEEDPRPHARQDAERLAETATEPQQRRDAERIAGAASRPQSRREGARLGAWVRRLYADADGNLIAMDSRARTFPTALAGLLRVRDQGLCRTPYCDAPIAHIDHITPAAAGGRTNAFNGQGLCAGCNYAKQAAGWAQRVDSDAPRHTVVTTTPTGHTATSVVIAAPTPLGQGIAAEGIAVPHDGASVEPAESLERGPASFTGRLIDLVSRRPDESPLEIALAHAS